MRLKSKNESVLPFPIDRSADFPHFPYTGIPIRQRIFQVAAQAVLRIVQMRKLPAIDQHLRPGADGGAESLHKDLIIL